MNLKNLFMLLCAFAGLTLTSCLSDDDNDNTISPLTPQQKLAQLTDMAGPYSGKVFFVNDSTQLIDSISGTTWNVTANDSALVIDNLPLKVLAHGLPETELKRELLKSEATTQVFGNISPYVNENNSKQYYTFWVIPKDYKTSFKYQFGEMEHDFTVEFDYQLTAALSSYYSTMTYYATGEYYNSQFVTYILLKRLSCDGSNYQLNKVLIINGKRSRIY